VGWSLMLSERSIGWLRHLHRKAHTPDDWSRTGRPHPHWDQISDPPTTSFPRFDLTDSSYPLALMVQVVGRPPSRVPPAVVIT